MSVLEMIQKRRAEMKETAARTKMTTKQGVASGWIQLKDFLLVLYLLNTLIGMVQKVDIASLMEKQTRTIIINRVAQAKEPEAKTEAKEEEKLIGEFSAYNSEPNQTDSDPFTMASGKRVYDGAIACPTKYSFGTKVKVAGKTYTCEDRMGAAYRTDKNFDIWMESAEKAKSFGRKEIAYEIIK